MIRRIASAFGTGSDPGCPMQTGHVSVFGSSPKVLRQPQNIFVAVLSSTWHSSPITVSHPAIAGTAYPGPGPAGAVRPVSFLDGAAGDVPPQHRHRLVGPRRPVLRLGPHLPGDPRGQPDDPAARRGRHAVPGRRHGPVRVR